MAIRSNLGPSIINNLENLKLKAKFLVNGLLGGWLKIHFFIEKLWSATKLIVDFEVKICQKFKFGCSLWTGHHWIRTSSKVVSAAVGWYPTFLAPKIKEIKFWLVVSKNPCHTARILSEVSWLNLLFHFRGWSISQHLLCLS